MRRMYSENELKGLVHAYLEAHPEDLVASLDEQDIELGDVTCGDLTASGDVAIAGDANITGDVSVKTITQTQANVVVDFVPQHDSIVALGVTCTNVYSRFEVVNNMLYLVINVLMQNNTDSDISISSNKTFMYNYGISVPTTIGDKVFDFGGNKVSESQSAASVITYDKIPIEYEHSGGYEGFFDAYLILNHPTTDKIGVSILGSSTTITLAPTKRIFLTARTFLTLI